MGIDVKITGGFANTERWLTKLSRGGMYASLNAHARAGVAALARATPKESARTANSWQYRIIKGRDTCTIEWYNTNVQNGSVIAILIQYGHGTGTGGYVKGTNYINPAIKPIFDDMIKSIVKEVSS